MIISNTPFVTGSRISAALTIFLFSAIPALAQTPTPNREEPKQEQVSQARIASGDLTGEQVASALLRQRHSPLR
ncbi:hypothetical protein [Leptolyngbya sp. 7M]|uniref:hypothetical protein n=1 Tax=Leptolyngbya sp. 7M TaxID=2812896 RepID=UPI001B8A8D7F|nr:hypothetical protein [Leptolyngbya sp. 7M]QYO61965.1 hypothetical protein JVX88_17710 [Leptolyngbya sp. 7M]